MKRVKFFDRAIALWRKYPLSICWFWLLCLNGAIAPAVWAASGETLTRTAAWALGLLGFVTLGLSIYLFAVIFKPDRF